MSIAVRIVNPQTDPDWDTRIASFPDATPFHTAAWARVIAATYRYTSEGLIGAEGADVSFVMPVMEVRPAFARPRAVCLPFSDECRPLARSTSDRASALAEICRRGQERGWQSIEIRGSQTPPVEDAATPGYFGHSLDLALAGGALEKRYHPSIRQGVRKSERLGLSISYPDTPEAIQTFYRLQCMTRKRHGLPPQPFALFRAIHKEFIARGTGFIAMVKDGSRPLAAVLFLTSGSKAIYKFGASASGMQNGRPNTLAMAFAIKRCQEMGIRHVDFGRTDPENAGLRTYKLRWGTTERVFRYERYDTAGHPLPPRRVAAHGYHNLAFRVLPLPVLRLLGTILYRFMG